jgi:hypothetical protein
VTSQILVNESGRYVVRTHPYSHWLSNTLHVSDIDVGSVLIGSTALITALLSFVAQELPRFLGDFPKLGQ